MSIPIVYINLASDLDRRHRLDSEFQRLGLTAQRLEAIWWAGLSDAEQRSYYSEELNRAQFHVPLLQGEKGCYVSHLHAWEMLLASEHPAMVVLEDDVLLDDRFPAAIQAVASLDLPWDMLKLIGRKKEKVRRVSRWIRGIDLVDYTRVPSLTAGYVISRQGARKLLNSRKPFGRPIDVDLRHWWENDLMILGVTPPVLMLDETSQVSSIGERNAHHPWPVKSKKFWLKLKMTILNLLHQFRRGGLIH